MAAATAEALPLHALVVGATGVSGAAIAEALVAAPGGWTVTGVSRRSPRSLLPLPARQTGLGWTHVAVDVTDTAAARAVLGALPGITHVFYATWAREATEEDNCRVNGAMLRNTLDAVAGPALRHVALVTGLKHYLGPFEAYAAAGAGAGDTPFRETTPRLPFANFYYTQEDILMAAAAARGFTWTVHRPHTLVGDALGHAMNMGVTLAVYASLCKATGAPFVFPGSPEQYSGVTDVTDARLLGRHVVWAVREPRAHNRAFNVVNGDVFRWRQLWADLADALGVPAAPYPGYANPLEHRMGHADAVWADLVVRHGLQPFRASALASWWHTDADLGRQKEAFADMSQSRRLGFHDMQVTADSFRDLFERLRAARIIP
jgi:nucleoside-diphosphate-sugar epimerase